MIISVLETFSYTEGIVGHALLVPLWIAAYILDETYHPEVLGAFRPALVRIRSHFEHPCFRSPFFPHNDSDLSGER